MASAAKRYTLTFCLGLAAATIAGGLAAQQQVYRYVDPDGRTVYSDRAPSAAAKDVQPKRLGANFIENDVVPLAARNASENFPVTLYTFACGEICQTAETTLNRRGIPFTQVNVEDPKGAERLKALTGEMTAPVLQVGDKLVAKGFNETRWQALLDEAGYPKTAAPKRSAAPARAAEPARAEVRSEPQVAPVPAVGGGYPKN